MKKKEEKEELKEEKKEEKKELLKKSFIKENLSTIITVGIIAIVVFSLAIMVSNNKKLEPTSHIIEVSYEEYEEKIAEDKFTIVLLASPSCSHCQKYKPLLNKALDDYGLEASYLNVNGSVNAEQYTKIHDSYTALKDKYGKGGLPSIPTPTTLIVRNGMEVGSISGNLGYDGFVKFLRENNVL